MKRFFIIILFVFVLLPAVSGQDPEKKQYIATRITTPPVINGILDDEAWQSGSWAGEFTQNEPYNGRPESQKN